MQFAHLVVASSRARVESHECVGTMTTCTIIEFVVVVVIDRHYHSQRGMNLFETLDLPRWSLVTLSGRRHAAVACRHHCGHMSVRCVWRDMATQSKLKQ